MDVALLLVPYDSAQRGARLGAGPERLVAAGLAAELAQAGHPVGRTVIIEPSGGRVAEIRTAFDLMRALAVAARDARKHGLFPLVLAGNCNTCLGTVAGLGDGGGTAVLWFDAHGDFNTPETTTSAFLDGMALATLNGRCWSQLARTVPNFTPVSERTTCLLGARDLDPLEGEALSGSALHVLPPARIETGLPAVVADIASQVARAYLHLDLDVLDPREGRANEFAVDGGLSVAALQDAIAVIGKALPIGAAAITAYDPALDRDGRIAAAAIALAKSILNASS